MMGMTEIIRGRDCILFFKSDSHVVTVGDEMLAGGWAGGQIATWKDVGTDERTVTYSNGYYGGVLIWGSNESADQWTAMTGQQLTARTAVMFAGGNLLSTSSYERYTWTSRRDHAINPANPLIPIIYQPNSILFASLRGLWTTEDELSLSGSLLAPCFFTGMVLQVPKLLNNYFLGVQTGL